MEEEYQFSIIIPTFNRGFVLADALESVYCQGIEDIQVIVIDDGSTDDTVEVLKPYRNRITYRYQKNQGQSVARNKGIALARGEYICFLDSDDVFLEGKLEKELELFRQYPTVEAIVSDAEDWVKHKRRDQTALHPGLRRYQYPKLLADFPSYWHARALTATCCNTIKRSVLNKVGQPFFEPSLPVCEDWDFFARAYHHSVTLVVPDVTAKRRRFDDNTRKNRNIPGEPQTAEQKQFFEKYKSQVMQRVATLVKSEYMSQRQTTKIYHELPWSGIPLRQTDVI